MVRKLKCTLNSNGNKWVEDEERYGFKMLSKMGWKMGKGLGKNEDGNTSHIKVTKKNDYKGVGFVGSDDNWIAHQDDFNSILSSLNGQTENKQIHTHDISKLNALNTKSELPKMRSLYKKFLKGKDMSNYSLKDMDAIFGNKKKFRSSEISKEKLQLLNDDNLHENNSLQNCHISKKNIQEYFTEKMENKNQKRKKNSVIVSQDNIIESSTSSNDNNRDINNSTIFVNDQIEEEKLKTTLEKNTNEVSEQNTNVDLTTEHCLNLNYENEHLSNNYTNLHDKNKKCKSSKKELCNISSKIEKKGKKRKQNYCLEEKSIENNDAFSTVKCEESDESLYKVKNKRRKIEEENDHHIKYTKNRYKVLQEISMFSDTFPNSNTLSILEKYEKLQEQIKNSAFGTSNLFTLNGYGNVSLLS